MPAFGLRSVPWLAWALLALSFLSGCGGSDDSGSAGRNFVTAPLYGQVTAEGHAVAGITVTVAAPDGRAFVEEVTLTDDSGAFAVTVTAPEAGPLLVETTLSDGLVLRAEIEKYVPDDFFQVNHLTSLAHAYRQAHPDVSVPVALTRVYDFLAVPSEWRIDDEPVNAELSGVSGLAFMNLAATDKQGFDHYLRTLVARMDAGETLALASEGRVLRDDLDIELANRVVSSKTPGVKLGRDVEKSFAGGASSMSLLSNVAGIVFKAIAAYRDREERAKVDAALTRIEAALADIRIQIQDLSRWIIARFDVSDYTTLSNQINSDVIRITSAYQKVVDATRYAGGDPKNTTDLDNTIQGLYQFGTNEIQGSAQNIHLTQWGKDPLSGSMLGLARNIVGASSFSSLQTLTDLDRQVETYVGYQVQAVSVLASLGQPGLRRDAADPYQLAYTFSGNAAGHRNLAARQIDEVVDRIQLQRTMVARQLPDSGHAYDVVRNYVYRRASLSGGSGGNKFQYVRGYASGGLANWVIADRPSVSDLMKRFGGSAKMNQNFGVQFQPGKVEYLQQRFITSCRFSCVSSWHSDGMITATPRGYLTIDARADGKAEYGWVDDAGNSGRIGEGWYNDAAGAMDSHRGVYVKTESNPSVGLKTDYWVGQINGPVILQSRLAAKDVQAATAVAIGLYAGLAVARDPARGFAADVLSTGNSGTEGLKAVPIAVAGGPAVTGQDLTAEVLWEALDPATLAPVDRSVATISNLRNVSEPPSPEYAMPRSGMAMIHWMPDSFGREVTFRASRYRPNGSRVTGELTLASPVVRAAAAPDALDLFPPRLQSTSRRLAEKGIQLYATRHWPRGWFEDVTGAVTYTSSHPNVTVSASGFVSVASGRTVEPGTTVTITATDAAIRVQAGIATRPTDSCEIRVD